MCGPEIYFFNSVFETPTHQVDPSLDGSLFVGTLVVVLTSDRITEEGDIIVDRRSTRHIRRE